MKILVAEDDLIPRRVLERTLSTWGYEVDSVADGGAAWAALSSESPPRMAILDWQMPEVDGLEVCRRLRRDGGEDGYVYVLLLTGRSDTQDIVAGLEAGADDYLTKPFEPAELKARLRVGRRMLDLHAQLIAAREQLRVRATRDPLTGLLNRGAIVETFEHELSRGHREGRPVGVLLVDIDHFKRINDSHGHLTGDRVLSEISRRLMNAVRPYDGLGRYGGEEFLLVLPGCDEASAFGLAERLRREVAGTPIVTDDGAIPVTISVGVTVATGPTPGNGDPILRSADKALYQAKSGGRNRVELAPSPTP